MHRRSYSFIIPALDDAAGLARHLEYFSNVAERVELVIIDDCSGDRTPEVVENARLPPNITLKYRRNPVNLGPGPSRNEGLKQATGDFVMFLDADDLLADCFFDFIRLAPMENGADFALFGYHLAASPQSRFSHEMRKTDAALFAELPGPGFPTQLFTLAEAPQMLRMTNYPWNKLYRREFLHAAGITFPDFRLHEDILPHWHSFMRARRFAVLGWAPPLIHHFEDENGNRATNHVGPDRLDLFPILEQLHHDIGAHPARDILLPQFNAFHDAVFDWLVNVVARKPDAMGRNWREAYLERITAFRRGIDRTGRGGCP